MLNNLEKDIRDRILYKLDDMESLPTKEMGDLSLEMWELENKAGTVTCSKREAREWINEHLDDLQKVLDNSINQELTAVSAFIDAERFMVRICIEVTSTLLYKAQEDGEGMTLERLKESLKNL